MIETGKYNTMRIVRFVDFGAYLTDSSDGPDADEREILMPAKYIDDALVVGDCVDVFVYLDSGGRPVATTEQPLATVGEFAFMKAAQVNSTGAFMDWGVTKQLLVPFSEQKVKMQPGGVYLVYVYFDNVSGRIVGSTRLSKHLGNVYPDYKHGDKVNCLVWQQTNIGYRVIVDNLHAGMIYENELFRPLETGDKVEGYVRQVRPDGKIDITLSAPAAEREAGLAERVLAFLRTNSGRRLSDKDSPDVIRSLFSCSKKDFKKAVGHLYRDKKVEIGADGEIKLV